MTTATEEKKGNDSDKTEKAAQRGGRRRGEVLTGPFLSRRREKNSIIQNVSTCIYFQFSKIVYINYVLG